jgi:hypothetical protein
VAEAVVAAAATVVAVAGVVAVVAEAVVVTAVVIGRGFWARTMIWVRAIPSRPRTSIRHRFQSPARWPCLESRWLVFC